MNKIRNKNLYSLRAVFGAVMSQSIGVMRNFATHFLAAMHRARQRQASQLIARYRHLGEGAEWLYLHMYDERLMGDAPARRVPRAKAPPLADGAEEQSPRPLAHWYTIDPLQGI